MAAGTEFCYPSHLLVHQMMEELIEWLGTSSHLHPIERATEAHVRFVTIHPFADGNGRVGRLLLNLLLIQSGYPIAVLSVEKRSAYIDSLVAAQNGKGSETVLQLVCEAVKLSLRETIELCVTSATAKEMSSVEIVACKAWINEES